MKAIVFQGVEHLSYETVPEPEIRTPDDVILRVRLSAICGSDLHVYHGREAGLDPGTVMGHEMIGEVVEAGSEVHRFGVGDAVGRKAAFAFAQAHAAPRRVKAYANFLRGPNFIIQL